MNAWRGGIAPALLWIVACTGPGDVDDDAGAAEMELACECAPDEDCSPCFEQIGRCCYDGDGLIRGTDNGLPQREALAHRCEQDPSCRACCAECAELSCEEIQRGNLCPPAGPP